ncbi:hypothetical protein [Photobacterium leiognathi]|uniref:hypothetical protein n=1 Tax=Photobacterium leiognathi TaxID=553611 RepID=UPI0027387519|nr:hypothetical protein [Photobacterium leiognathi]
MSNKDLNVLNIVVYDDELQSTTIMTLPYSSDLQMFVQNDAVDKLFSNVILDGIEPEDNPEFLENSIAELSYQARVFINRGFFKNEASITSHDIPLIIGNGKKNSILPLFNDSRYELSSIEKLAAYTQMFSRYQASGADLYELKEKCFYEDFDDYVHELKMSQFNDWYPSGIINTFNSKEIKNAIGDFDAQNTAISTNFIATVKSVLSINASHQKLALFLNGKCFHTEIDELEQPLSISTFHKELEGVLSEGGLSCVKPLI